MSELRLSQNGLQALKQSEGSLLKAYQDQRGIWTIGYGHTGKVNGVPVHKGMQITPEQQDQLLMSDLQYFENVVRNNVKVPLNQNQYDALVSFAFNVGGGAFTKSTLLKYLNLGDYNEAGDQLLRWSKTDGKLNKGLLNRRQRERSMFLGKETPLPNNYMPANEPYDLPKEPQKQYDFSAFNIPNTLTQSTVQTQQFIQPQQSEPSSQTTQPQNSFSSFMNDLQTMTPQMAALEPTSPKLDYRKQYQNQLAQAFGVTPKAELPNYISELVRSIYDQA